ncbi:hypothetical protein HW132_18715 [Brasilonema sp. CT11]|nr:hypothetical protein [Brasilonema sp. CT11]
MEHGESDRSDFIEKAVQEKIFRSTIQEVHDRNTAFPSEEIESVIDEALYSEFFFKLITDNCFNPSPP